MSIAQTITSLEAVLDLAVWLEKNGRTFYEKAAQDTSNAGLRELFEALAAGGGDGEDAHDRRDDQQLHQGEPGAA